MLCARSQANVLMRLLPIINRHARIQIVQMGTSFPRTVVPSADIHQSSLVGHNRPLALFSLPRRYLASDHHEDYILHKNSLTETEKKEIEAGVKKDFEDWVPYGFCPTDKEEDIYRYKMFMFTCLTFTSVLFIYFFMHLPPRNKREWVAREAYLELERRQKLGLPLVDKDLIPADKILLPSLEELGDDYDIII